MKVLCFDVGFTNLGVCLIHYDETDLSTKPHIRVEGVWKIDINEYNHAHVANGACRGYHTNEPCDKLLHSLEQHEALWTPFDKILIERQPPQGLIQIEAILFQKWRDRAQKISPTSMHRFYGLSDCYDTRKLQTVDIATPYLLEFPTFSQAERKHDLADSFCLAAYMISTWHEKTVAEHNESERKRALEADFKQYHGESLDNWFDQYRHENKRHKSQ